MENSLFEKTKSIVEKHSFSFKKNFGQNFLTDNRVLDKIINSAELTKDDTVMEIGPGIGTLTCELAKRAGKVIAYEIDKTLIPVLSDTLSEYDNVTIINEDILKADLQEECKKHKNIKVVANLPYYITAPVIMRFLEENINIKSITVMVQKEVALRMQAKYNTKDYGTFSLAVQYYSEPYLVANVPRNCFIPRPNVDSAVVRLTPFENPPVVLKDTQTFFNLIKVAFSQRRKTLVNCLFASDIFSFVTKEEICQLLKFNGFDEKIRGEALSLNDFAVLSDILFENKK